MSKVFKAFQITGKHQLEDIDPADIIEKDKQKDNKQSKQKEDLSLIQKNSEQLLAEAKKEATAVLEKARQEAREIKEQAQQQAEQMKEKTRKEGFAEGQRQGRQEALDKAQEKIENLQQVLAALKEEQQKENETLAAKVISLAVQISEKIIGSSLEIKPELINEIVLEMVSEINENYESVEIKVASELIEFLDQEQIAAHLNADEIEFVGQPSLKMGDCVIETDFGGRDGIIENKLELLEEELYKGAGYHD